MVTGTVVAGVPGPLQGIGFGWHWLWKAESLTTQDPVWRDTQPDLKPGDAWAVTGPWTPSIGPVYQRDCRVECR